MTGKRLCRLCHLSPDLPEDVRASAERLYSLMDEKERAGEDLIRQRLEVCASCPRKAGDTCLSCGCYVLIRTLSKSSRCPSGYWK